MRRVGAGSDSEADKPAGPLPGKGGRRKPVDAEHMSEHDRENGIRDSMLPPPPPPPPPVKHVVTAAGALRAKNVVLEVCAQLACPSSASVAPDTFSPVEAMCSHAHV